MTSEEARARLQALGLGEAAAEALLVHFEDAELRGKRGHGLTRVAWLESLDFDPAARPHRVLADPGFERWSGNGNVGDWEPWILYAGGIWALAVILLALKDSVAARRAASRERAR